MRRSARAILVIVLCGLLTSCGHILPFVGIETESYRPPTASTTRTPNCMAEDIVAALGGSASWDPNVTVDAPTPGYPPRYFEPVEVLRCERALSADNVLTLDSVRLRGDVEAAMGEFAVPSTRLASGIMASCAYSVEAPVGLWFVDASGRAFRPAWPAEPCGLRDEPLRVLNELDEVSRTVYPTGYDYDYATVCAGPATTGEFYDTSDSDVASAAERQRAGEILLPPALVAPTADVGFLQICTYTGSEDADTSPADYETAMGTSFTLDRPDSIELLGYIAKASIAQPCSTPATRFAFADLRRPDGSGTARITIELDGCRRVAGLGFLRELPLEAYDVLSRDRQ
ncbi:hypothetical protein CH254_22580 [Rhodococcus sp. 06-412-2C]|uniref:hypothetical protein n=1 Tax=unclassified Rhodococcus (in: high G+C Gram-positive bacteria) TaxID=192944 RepID=UPI000B9B02B8|nr:MULTISPECIES: hypothetical protein [unclassified Rhodococcus (in: high G+C Gram-positive bacteria)]OZC83713.1 hypothetical protein CH254_22580 [Rhodococcus sp. 06-412-2C]OZC93900.1 hypothetical protein CH279_20660 [Rhodococcus sp. 06-412-2B]